MISLLGHPPAYTKSVILSSGLSVIRKYVEGAVSHPLHLAPALFFAEVFDFFNQGRFPLTPFFCSSERVGNTYKNEAQGIRTKLRKRKIKIFGN